MKNETAQKIRVGILFGGKSAEHEVSLRSAKNVVDALDKNNYDPILIGVDKSGKWHAMPGDFFSGELATEIVDQDFTDSVCLTPGDDAHVLVDVGSGKHVATLDVVFPILHGPMGEDGTVQGLLELVGVPYVGPGVLGSAVGMDKDVMKRLLRDASIAVAPFMVVKANQRADVNAADIFEQFGKPVFVKPANMGSSVGVSRASTEQALLVAIDNALQFDDKILIEKAIEGSEIECAILGNGSPKASKLGRIVPRQGDFYSYEAKYIDENGAVLEIPANLSESLTKKIQEIALSTFKTLGCEGLSRVDMFVSDKGEVVVNEINTIPGFTKISMYPKLWEASGMTYGDLITELLTLAMDRHKKRLRLTTSYKKQV